MVEERAQAKVAALEGGAWVSVVMVGVVAVGTVEELVAVAVAPSVVGVVAARVVAAMATVAPREAAKWVGVDLATAIVEGVVRAAALGVAKAEVRVATVEGNEVAAASVGASGEAALEAAGGLVARQAAARMEDRCTARHNHRNRCRPHRMPCTLRHSRRRRKSCTAWACVGEDRVRRKCIWRPRPRSLTSGAESAGDVDGFMGGAANPGINMCD